MNTKRAIVHGFGYLATLVIVLNALVWVGPRGAVGLGSAIAYVAACAVGSVFIWRKFWRWADENWQLRPGFLATGAVFFAFTLSLTTYFWTDPSVFRFFLTLISCIFAFAFIREAFAVRRRKLRIYPPTVLALAETPVDPELETRHVLASGTTGSGKSQVVRRAARMARLRNQPALCLDINGELMSRLFRPGHDIIIAAHDARAQAWSPLAELSGEFDAARIAAAMIPLEGSAEAREWSHYARTYFEACLIACLRDRSEPATNRRLAQLVASATPDYLRRVVGLDHAVAGMLSPGAERMFASAQGIAAARIGMALRALHPDAGIDSLSVARHVIPEQLENGGWIFVPVPAQVRDPAFAVASILAGVVVDALLAMGEDPDRRYWLICDELGQYPAIAGLARALTLGRKYGLAAVVAIQSVAQLRREFGPDGATELLSCLVHKVILRPDDGETAEWASRELGEKHVTRFLNEGNEHKQTEQHSIERRVVTAELRELPDLRAYVASPSNPNWEERQVVEVIDLGPPRMEAFIPRETAAGAELADLQRWAREAGGDAPEPTPSPSTIQK